MCRLSSPSVPACARAVQPTVTPRSLRPLSLGSQPSAATPASCRDSPLPFPLPFPFTLPLPLPFQHTRTGQHGRVCGGRAGRVLGALRAAARQSQLQGTRVWADAARRRRPSAAGGATGRRRSRRKQPPAAARACGLAWALPVRSGRVGQREASPPSATLQASLVPCSCLPVAFPRRKRRQRSAAWQCCGWRCGRLSRAAPRQLAAPAACGCGPVPAWRGSPRAAAWRRHRPTPAPCDWTALASLQALRSPTPHPWLGQACRSRRCDGRQAGSLLLFHRQPQGSHTQPARLVASQLPSSCPHVSPADLLHTPAPNPLPHT